MHYANGRKKVKPCGTLQEDRISLIDNKVKIESLGGIPPLIDLLKNGTKEGKEYVAGIDEPCSRKPDNKVKIASLRGSTYLH